MRHIGIPGIGGSLGQCQICGKNFMMEMLLGMKVGTITIPAFADQTLYVHPACAKALPKNPASPSDFQDGPIRTALDNNEAEMAQATCQ